MPLSHNIAEMHNFLFVPMVMGNPCECSGCNHSRLILSHTLTQDEQYKSHYEMGIILS